MTSSCPRSARTPRTPSARSPSIGSGPAGLSVRLLPGPPGLQADGLRGRAAAGRHAGAGHPGLPPAARGARPRGPDDRATWACSFEYGKALGRDFTLQSLQGRGLRGRVPRRRRPAGRRASACPARTARASPTASRSSSTYNVERHGRRWASTWWSSAAATRPSTPPAPPCASAPRRSRSSTAAPRAQMPAWGEEIDAADHEGIELMTLVRAGRRSCATPPARSPACSCRPMALGDYDAAAGAARWPATTPTSSSSADTGHRRHRPVARQRRPCSTARRSSSTAGATSPPTRTPARPRSTGSSPAATPPPARRRWSRPSAPASGAPSASTSSSPAPTTPSGVATSSRRHALRPRRRPA